MVNCLNQIEMCDFQSRLRGDPSLQLRHGGLARDVLLGTTTGTTTTWDVLGGTRGTLMRPPLGRRHLDSESDEVESDALSMIRVGLDALRV